MTTDVGDDPRKGKKNNDDHRNSSITDYEEDVEVSLSKFAGGLGNRMLKDQLSMVSAW